MGLQDLRHPHAALMDWKTRPGARSPTRSGKISRRPLSVDWFNGFLNGRHDKYGTREYV